MRKNISFLKNIDISLKRCYNNVIEEDEEIDL